MNPVTNLWYGVDPLAEKYATTGGYVYTLDNPVKFVDPNGESSGLWDWLFGPKPWIKRGPLIKYAGNGVFVLNINNFSKGFQNYFHRANNDSHNWGYNEVGINTTVAYMSNSDYAAHMNGSIPSPNIFTTRINQ